LHGDVGAKQPLHLDSAFRRKRHAVAVDMRAEGYSLFGDLAQLRERHDLEAAGVGQHRAVPAGKGLQAAERRDTLGAGPQHQVVGIAEHDVGAGFAHVAPVQALHGSGRSNRHERGRPHHPVRRRQATGPRGAVGRKQLEVVGKRH
jgi:hypothetical protein